MKKGFTLIELVVCIFIIMSLISIGRTSYMTYEKTSSEFKTAANIDKFINIVNNAKAYTYSNGMRGSIIFTKDSNKIQVLYEDKTYREFVFENGFKFNSISYEDSGTYSQSLNISEHGLIVRACTIEFKDKNSKLYKFTAAVGVNNVRYKE